MRLCPLQERTEPRVLVARIGLALVVQPRQGGGWKCKLVWHCCCHPVPPVEWVIGIVASTSWGGRSSRRRKSEVPRLPCRGEVVRWRAPGSGGGDPVGPSSSRGIPVGAIEGP